jgi:hypothetical protein
MMQRFSGGPISSMALLHLLLVQLLLLVLPFSLHLLTTTSACEVTFNGVVDIVFNESAQVDLCEIVLSDLSITIDGLEENAVTHACVTEQFAGNETEYGPFALSSFVVGGDGAAAQTINAMAVGEREIGETGSFAPYVYPFDGSVLSFQFTVWPAFNDTFCGDGGGDGTSCNATTLLNVDVFGCFVQPATPSPTLPPATPRPSAPPFVMTMPTPTVGMVPTDGGSQGGGGVMATRSPTMMPADVPSDSPVPKTEMAVVTKDPFKPPVTPSPAIFPVPSPTIILPPVVASPPVLTSDAYLTQSSAAAASSSPTRGVILLLLQQSFLIGLVTTTTAWLLLG